MSVTMIITIKDLATADVLEAQRQLAPKQLQATVGPRCRELTRDNFARLPRNKRGWPSTGFWEQCARATRWEPADAGVRLIVDKIGARQRWKGGAIRPVNKDALTIPINPISYGKTVADFPGAFLITTKKGAYIVMYGNEGGVKLAPGGRRRRSATTLKATLNFLFKLSPGVVQAPNPDVMPTDAEFADVVRDAVAERLAAIKLRKGGQEVAP